MLEFKIDLKKMVSDRRNGMKFIRVTREIIYFGISTLDNIEWRRTG